MPTFENLINQSFGHLGVTKPGELVSNTIRDAAFLLLQDLWMGWANDPTLSTFFSQANGPLSQNVEQYVVGAGGTGGFGVGVFNPIRLLSWKAEDATNFYSSGGPIIPLATLRDLQKNGAGRRNALPEAVGCDLGNNRVAQTSNSAFFTIFVYPRPAVTGVSLSVDYLGRLGQFVSVADTIALPEGYELALQYHLAIALAPQYSRIGGVPDSLTVDAANSLKFIRDRNAAILGLQQVQAQPPQQ